MYKRVLAASLSLPLCATAAVAQPTLETDEQRTLYALGAVLGQQVAPFELSEQELAIVTSGLNDAVRGDELMVDLQTYGPLIQALADERTSAAAADERAASAEFLSEMANEPGAEQTESGLVYIPVTEGQGASPTAEDTVRVHYHGTLRDGTVFDSSVDRGEPVSLPLDGVIPCWTEGVQKMQVGGTYRLICPAELAYGDSGTGPIPGGATLSFEVELLGIEEPTESAPQ